LTLLITLAGMGYALACSDMRISLAKKNGTFTPLDETFNKHIVFHSNGVTANISYTGVARWTVGGRTVNLYDIISEAAVQAAEKNLAFGPFTLAIVERIVAELEVPALQAFRSSLEFELHITGYHQQLPFPFIAVMSSYRRAAPWSVPAEIQQEAHFSGISWYFKLAETPEVIFGGSDQYLRMEEKNNMLDAVRRGADAFNMARLAASLIERVSQRTAIVGPKSVSILLPQQGMLDTNLWERTPTGLNAFLPRLVFPGGTKMGPSVFPIEMQLMANGHLPKQSLFAKSVVVSSYKRSVRRRIFRLQHGKSMPGIMGLLMLALFGNIPDEYEDFGLKSPKE